MAKIKKPAPNGGKKNAAPKKAPARKKPIPQQVAEAAVAARTKPAAVMPDLSGRGDLPLHPTVEEQFSAEERRRMDVANGLARRVEREFAARRHSLDNPSLLRRAWDRVKRAFRYRSAKTGEYVTKQYAEANPDTTIREKAD